MTVPSALFQVVVNGGGPQAGSVSAPNGATLQFSIVSSVGVGQYLWELLDYPPGLTLPAGWSNNAGIYYSQGATPPVITLPGAGINNWGPIIPRLRINGNPLATRPDGTPNPAWDPTLVSQNVIVSVASPTGCTGLGAGETTLRDALRAWVGPVMHDIRLLDAAIAGFQAAGGIRLAATFSAGPVSVPGSTMAFIDLTAGTVAATPPAVAQGVSWGVKDWKGQASLAKAISIANGSSLIEDPNKPGVYSTNPILITTPNMGASWMSPEGVTWSLLPG